ncbi:MAG TPA: DNA-3-methyladenine glycosylase [Steroidobacteraceae bacterium]|nr:DNA-3-methyladenine glycosylase [Steroidobacteraceae bacterium]
MSKAILAHLSAADPVLAGVIRAVGPRKPPPPEDGHPFEVLARAIAHQQLNGTAANTILGRLVQGCGQGAFPTPQMVLAASVESLRAAGFSFAKVAALKDLAARTLDSVVPDGAALAQLPDEEIIARLTQVRGVGRWTVEMLLIFQLGRPDVLPVDDFGVRNGFRVAYGLRRMPRPKALAAYGERWKPYRSMAAWYLWRAVELKREGRLPEPAERIRLPRLAKRRAARKLSRATKKPSRAARKLRRAASSSARPRRSGARTR